jgi:hypothetical protein
MSFFDNAFDDLRSKAEFQSFVDETTTHQGTSEHIDRMNEQEEKRKKAIKEHICKLILAHFNSDDKDNFDVNKQDLTIYVGHLDTSDQNKLKANLEGKGYVVTIANDKMTIGLA